MTISHCPSSFSILYTELFHSKSIEKGDFFFFFWKTAKLSQTDFSEKKTGSQVLETGSSIDKWVKRDGTNAEVTPHARFLSVHTTDFCMYISVHHKGAAASQQCLKKILHFFLGRQESPPGIGCS